MADSITIKVKLDDGEIDRAAQQVSRKVTNALDVGRAEAQRRAAQLQTQLQTAMEARERAHALRVAQIYAQSAAQLEAIERRKQAQLEVIRERAVLQEQARLKRLESAAQASAQRIGAVFRSLGGLVPGLGVAGLVGSAINKAFDVDAQRVQLAAFVGGIDNANKKLAEFSKIAQATAGVTKDKLTQSFIDLKAQAKLSDEQATKLAVSLTKLQALFPKAQNTAQNLAQIFNQQFELGDIKQERGQTGDFIDSVIKRLGFEGPNAIKLIRAAQKQGKLTQDAFWNAVDDEVIARSANLTETLQLRVAKAAEATNQKMAELGDKLLKDVIPVLEKLLKLINPILDAVNKLPDALKLTTLAVVAFAPSILRVTEALGGLRVAALSLGGFLTTPAGIALLALLGIGTAVVGLRNTIATGEANIRQQLDRTPRDLSGKPIFQELPPGEVVGEFSLLKPLKFSRTIPTFNEAGVAKSVANSSRINASALADEHTKRQRQKTELEKANQELKDLTEQNEALRKNEGALFEVEFKILQARFEHEQRMKKLADKAFDALLTSQGRALPPQFPSGIGFTDEQRRSIGLAPALGSPAQVGGEFLAANKRLQQEALQEDAQRAAQLRFEEADQRLRIQEARIQTQITTGLLSQADAQTALNAVRSVARDRMIEQLEAQQKIVGAQSLEGLKIQEQIEGLRLLGVEFSNSQRFARGFNSQIESVGDAFERFGQNVSRALTNTKDLLNGLKNSVLQLFNDLLGQSLQNLVRNALAPLLGLGGALGGTGGTGGIGGIFRTPSTFPAQIAQAFAGAAGAGGGLSAPASISQTQAVLTAIGGLTGVTPGGIGGVGTGAGAASRGGILGGIFNSVFGGGAVSAFPPLLGASLGAGFGGQSTAGRILGGIGGAAVGLGAAFGSAVFGAGGGLAAAGLAALGPAALIGAPLIVGAILLGKASQRKKDEQAAGDFQRQAHDQLAQLKAGIASDQIDGSQARTIFENQILATFIQQINTLQTKSVRDSRLTNQVRDIRGIYDAIITPEITAQEKRRADQARFAAIDRRLIPQFAVGGISGGGGLAILHPNEMVLTPTHQAMLRFLAGPDVFDRIGVPGVQQQPIFDNGGIMSSGSLPSGPTQINLFVRVGVSRGDAQEITAVGLDGRTGENIVIKKITDARTRGRQI